MRRFGVPAAGVVLLIAGCGSKPLAPANTQPASAVPAKPQAASVEKANSNPQPPPAQAQSEIPHACTRSDGECYPPVEFVRSLCKKKYPGVALAMFEKNEPWRHAYIKVKEVAPINSLGGPSGFASLEFLEEVVLLRAREIKKTQMIMDVPNSFDVLRLDGTCATLAEDEFMTKKPYVHPRYAPVIWQQLDAPLRQALTQNPKVDQAASAQVTTCKGTFLAGGGEPCKAATQQLARAIVAALSGGLALPLPSKLPVWSVAEGATKPSSRTCPLDHPC